MDNKHPPVVFDEDNPEWTEANFARAKLGKDVLPPTFLAAFKRTPGRPKGSFTSTKALVSLRIDKDVLDRFKATGPGWQTRINEALKKVKVVD